MRLNLLYEKVAEMKASVTQMEDLVAVFSQRDGLAMLQVYHVAPTGAHLSPAVRIIQLRELHDIDLSDYNGPWMGFRELGMLRNDLLTKGLDFYPIELFFLEEDREEAFYASLKILAAYLTMQLPYHLLRLSDRGNARKIANIVQAALPPILHELDCRTLIAVLPASDGRSLITERNCRLFFDQHTHALNLETLMGIQSEFEPGWFLAYEEVLLLAPGLERARRFFQELRPVLRLAGQAEALEESLQKFAQTLYQRSAGVAHLRTAALGMITEYWLSQDEIQDLVAICPNNDFELYTRSGDGVRVYRVLDESRSDYGYSAGSCISLAAWMRDGLKPGYDQSVITFPVLYEILPQSREATFVDLGQVLGKMQQEQTLARTLWLLSQDLASSGLAQRLKNQDALLEMAVRACNIYSLSNPWLWRQGRWGVYLEGCYRALEQLLEQIISSVPEPVSSYYQAIQHWYGCYQSSYPEAEIYKMLDYLHRFLRSAGEGGSSMSDENQNRARSLVEIGESILRIPLGTAIEKEGEEEGEENAFRQVSISAVVQENTDFSEPVHWLSPLFLSDWEVLIRSRRSRQSIYGGERDIDTLIQRLRKLSNDLQRQKQLLFAPVHERVILSFAYQKEAEYIEGLLRDLESAAKLTVTLRNRWLDLHYPVDLELKLSNLGRVQATNLEILLAHPKGFQLLDESPLRGVASLPPGSSESVIYRIIPERSDAELRVEYTFLDRRGQRHTDTWTAHLNVRNLDAEPYRVKVNPYQFGRPIQQASDFYGRRAELQNILSLLKAGGKQNLLLRGPRRMGKTSLLYMLNLALSDSSVRRLFNIPIEWDDALDCVHPVFLSLQSFDIQGQVVEINQFFRSLLERIGEVFNLSFEERQIHAQRLEHRALEVGAVHAAQEQVRSILNQHPGERVTVLLDEYDEIYRPAGGNLDRHLREFVSSEQRLTWIIASTVALVREAKTYSSPWFNVFTILELSCLTENAAVELVEIPAREERVFWRSDAVLALLRETGCHPAFTQLFCAKVVAELNHLRTNYVLQDTVYSVAEQIIDEQETAHSHFEFYWQDTRGTGRLIMLILDAEGAPLRRDEIRRRVHALLKERFGELPNQSVRDEGGELIEWREQEFKNCIDWVEKIVNAISLDDQRHYFFTVPIFRRWLHRYCQSQDLFAETLNKIAKEMESDGLV
jgi:hypothetical protein